MRIISHRGNMFGPGSLCEKENVENALLWGFDVEVDVRTCGWRIYVGHDEPLFELPREWIRSDIAASIWFHAKDERAHDALSLVGHRVFVHDDEPSGMVVPDGLLWIHPRSNDVLPGPDTLKSAVILDIAGYPRIDKSTLVNLPFAVCTDWTFEWKNWLATR